MGILHANVCIFVKKDETELLFRAGLFRQENGAAENPDTHRNGNQVASVDRDGLISKDQVLIPSLK